MQTVTSWNDARPVEQFSPLSPSHVSAEWNTQRGSGVMIPNTAPELSSQPSQECGPFLVLWQLYSQFFFFKYK